jgi:hypothetical protein
MRFTYGPNDRPLEGYTIKQGLGRGGFGEVYRAVSEGGKEVALKLVQRNLDVELRGVSQCLNIKHANLVSVYDVKQAANGDSWVVMEFVQGDTLDKVIAEHPQGLPPEEALAWLRGICAGVGYLHEQGIVHRDLKPGNTFIENGLVKIGDYGLSKFISASRRSGQTTSIGTVHYMAPEVLKGRYGKEVDLYAVGVMLYEMLAGRVPFNGETPAEILMKHLTDTPDLTALPLAFRPVVARLLDKDPYRRYSSMQALLADLEGYLSRPPEAEATQLTQAPDSQSRTEEPPSASAELLRALAHKWKQHTSDPAAEPPNSWWKLDPYAAMGWLFVVACCIGLGAGGLIGSQWYDPARHNVGETWAKVGAFSSLIAGGVLLVLLLFHWAGRLADPDTLRKLEELKRRAGPMSAEHKAQPHGGVPAVLGKLTLALAVGAGVGLLVGGGTAIFAPSSALSDFSVVLGCGVGLIVFGTMAFGWLFGEPHESLQARRKVPAAQRETPTAGRDLPQEAGSWQPPSEHVS